MGSEAPAWTEPVPDSRPDGKVVACGGCGRLMTRGQFIHDHGPECDGEGADRE